MTLREQRRRLHMSLEATAYLANVHESTVSRVERGMVEPDPATVVKLAKAYGVSVKKFRELLEASKRAQSAIADRGEVPGAA